MRHLIERLDAALVEGASSGLTAKEKAALRAAGEAFGERSGADVGRLVDRLRVVVKQELMGIYSDRGVMPPKDQGGLAADEAMHEAWLGLLASQL